MEKKRPLLWKVAKNIQEYGKESQAGIIMDMNIRNFPDDLHRRLKMLCVERGVPLKKLVIEILGLYFTGAFVVVDKEVIKSADISPGKVEVMDKKQIELIPPSVKKAIAKEFKSGFCPKHKRMAVGGEYLCCK